MKKMDLCRSIDSIKQESELKEHILKAVEEKDKVTVIKRPLFVPAMVALLLCLNVGVIAKLIIFNKSQVNMSELRARTSMSSASESNFEDSLLDEEQRMHDQRASEIGSELDKLDEEQALLAKEKNEFTTALANVQSAINSDDYVIYDEWSYLNDYDPASEAPVYIDNLAYVRDNRFLYKYRRYVQKVKLDENSGVYTNHEFIVGYKGDCVDENIISITESDVAPINLTGEFISQTYNNMKNDPEVIKTYEAVGEEKTSEYRKAGFQATYYGFDNTFYLYSKEANADIDTANFVQRCYASADDQPNGDPLNSEVIGYYYINSDGKDITTEIEESVTGFPYYYYWKETVYLSEGGSKEKIQIPDVIGLPASEAENILKEAGFKISGRQYIVPPSNLANVKPNHVVGLSGEYFNDCNAGDMVYKDTPITLFLSSNLISVSGMPVDEAVESLRSMGYEVELKYINNTDPDDTDLYVDYTDPNGLTASVDKVTLFINSPDTDTQADLVGSVISMKRRHLYLREEGENIIEGLTPSEKTEIRFNDIPAYADWLSDTTAVGYLYGDEYFKIEEIKTTSMMGWCVPYLQCGVEIDYFTEHMYSSYGFYVNHNAEFTGSDYEDYNYMLHYSYKDGRNIYAYIKTEVNVDRRETITKMCVSENKLK